MRLSRVSRAVVLGVAAVGLLGSSACFGTFQATKKLYQFNKGVGDKWVVEVVFVALSIVQVYSLVVAADALVFNSVEFWTGENPMSSVSLSGTASGTQLRQTRRVDGDARVMVIEEMKAGELLSTTTMRLEKASEQVLVETKFADGRVERASVSRASVSGPAGAR